MKEVTRNLVVVVGSFACALILSSCGGGGSSGSDDVSVVDISADRRTIAVGGAAVLAVDITFDADRVTGGGNFYAVLRVPAELRYLDSSAEIDGLTSADDNSEAPIVTNCAQGEQYLAFEFSRSDLLRAANPSGDADMRLNLTLNGVAASASAIVSAAAEEDLPPYACGNVFVADADEVFQVQ